MDYIKELGKVYRNLVNLRKEAEITADLDVPAARRGPTKLPVKELWELRTTVKELSSEDMVASLKSRVSSVKEAMWAQVYYDFNILKTFDATDRALVCKTLLEQFSSLKLDPPYLWIDVLKRPEVFEDLAKDDEIESVPLNRKPDQSPPAPAPTELPVELQTGLSGE